MALFRLYARCLTLLLVIRPSSEHLIQFGDMIKCVTGRSPVDYTPYGCYCGWSGEGEPMDNIDRCCMEHDRCYDGIRVESITDIGSKCRVKLDNYKWKCLLTDRKTPDVICDTDDNWRCEQLICECDKAAVKCFAEHESEYPTTGRPVCPIEKSFVRKTIDKLGSFLGKMVYQ